MSGADAPTPLPNPLPQGEREFGGSNPKGSSPLAGEEGARREAVGRRGGKRDLRSLARRLRGAQTDAERRLWSIVRANRLAGWKFKRQEQIGDYIVDFVCFRARLIVEADGSQHAESDTDEARDAWLRGQGFRMLRFWNNDILTNSDGVATAILAALETPLPDPLAQGEREKCRNGARHSSSPLAGEDSVAYPRSGLAKLGEGANGASNG